MHLSLRARGVSAGLSTVSSVVPVSPFDFISELIAEKRWETARRICLQFLETSDPGASETTACLFQLHEVYCKLGDFHAAHQALERIVPANDREKFECAWQLAHDFLAFSVESFYRTSSEARTGLTYDEYRDRMQDGARLFLNQAILLEVSDADRLRLKDLMRQLGMKEIFPDEEKSQAAAPNLPVVSDLQPTGIVSGTLRFPDGSPALHVQVTLGLRMEKETPNLDTLLERDMGWPHAIAPMRTLVAETDAKGSFKFDAVPAGAHEFLAVTLDPSVYDIPTRFLLHSFEVIEGKEVRHDLTITEWTSAPPREVTSPFEEKIIHDGIAYHRVHQEILKNSFHYDFPRQLVSFALPPEIPGDTGTLLILSSANPLQPHPFQVTEGGAVQFFADLPRRSDRVFALYHSKLVAPRTASAPSSLSFTPEAGEATAVIETGRAAFRIAYGKRASSMSPLAGLRGEDGVWRGQGRFVLPAGMTIVSCESRVLESGPLLLSVELKYRMSSGADYTWILTAHQGEAYLLVREISPEIEGAAFEFSLREWSGGRGYLHWVPEGGSTCWTDLRAEDRELARLQESIAWWIPPQGFGYAMTPPELEQRDYIGIFTQRRGDWIDRKFEQVAQGPGDANRELDWPFPEMMGSTISMITAHTDVTGDAFFRFGFFDGERQWGVLASTLERNDGTWKELSAVQHKNSSPRLQDFKEWRLDEQDTRARPFLVAHRAELKELRKKTTSPLLAPYWERIRDGKARNGPVAGVLFLVANDPVVAWRKKLEIYQGACIRSKMVLLGRDFGDCYSPVGARILTPWAEEYDLLAASGVFSLEEERTIRQFLMLMGHMHMEPDLMNWKYNSRNANFEADRIDVVGTVGMCFLGNPDAERFVAHGIELMKKSLEVYCTPGSGKWYENPACYYLHASKCRMNFLFHLYRHKLFDATSIPRLKDFLRWGILLLTPPCPDSYEVMRDGLSGEDYDRVNKVRRLPPVGDHAHLGPWIPDHYVLAAKLYREKDPAFSDLLLAAYDAGGRDGSYYGNPPLIFSSCSEDDLRAGPMPELPSRRLEGFGAVLRDHFGRPDEFYLLFKQGPGGYRYHRTEGSFILFVGGRPLVYDGGEAGETWRHSTLSFYDAQMPLAAGHVERFHAFSGLDFVQGVHPQAVKPGEPVFLSDSCHHQLVKVAHERFAEKNPVNVRSILVAKDEYIVVHDDLHLDPSIPCRWHLQVVSDEHSGNTREGYLFKGRFGPDLQVLFPDQGFSEETVERLSLLDTKAVPNPRTGKMRGGYLASDHPRTAIRPETDSFAMRHLSVRADAPKGYVSILRPLTPGRKPIQARALENGNGKVGLAVSGDGLDDQLFLNRENVIFEDARVRFSGRYGAVLRRSHGCQCFLLAGSRLEAEGVSIVSDGPAVRVELFPDGRIELVAEGEGRIQLAGTLSPRVLDLSGGRITMELCRG